MNREKKNNNTHNRSMARAKAKAKAKKKEENNRQFEAARLSAFHAVKPTPECLPHFSTSFIQSSIVYGVLDSVAHSHPPGHGGSSTVVYDTTYFTIPPYARRALASRSSASHNLKRNKFCSSFLILLKMITVFRRRKSEVLGRGCNQTIFQFGRY